MTPYLRDKNLTAKPQISLSCKAKQTTIKKRSEIREKEDEAKHIDWDSSGLYVLLPNEEDYSVKIIAWCRNTMARPEHLP